MGYFQPYPKVGARGRQLNFDCGFQANSPGACGFIADAQNFMSSLPWSLFHVGHRAKSGSSNSLRLTSSVSRSTFMRTCQPLLKGGQGKFPNGRSYPGLVDELRGSLQMVNLISPLIIVYSWICETDVGVGVGSISITNSRFDIFVGHPCTTKGEGLLVWD